MSGTASTTPVRSFAGLARSGFRFHGFINRQLRACLGADPKETLAIFRSRQHSMTAPPGPKVSWLGEVIEHAEDIRRSLAIAHDYPDPAVREVLDFYAGPNLVLGTKNRIDGLNLVANDTDQSNGAGGSGGRPSVVPAPAASGREQACGDLTGAGVSILRARD